MRKVLIYSLLLVTGLVVSQFLDGRGATPIGLLTMVALSFIMIHVGYEFEVDRSRPLSYAWDYAVAATAAGFPWIFCALYFVFILAPPQLWANGDLWKESLLVSRFASPTSAGVLFSMLAAAGLAGTWVFRKARVLAIFDDLDTILLMIPLKILMVGLKWQLLILVLVIVVLLWIAWRYLHVLRWPVSWPWVMGYAAAITLVAEAVYILSKRIDAHTPIHLEVLLPAFVLGCLLARPRGADPHSNDALEGHEHGPESPAEQRVSTVVSAAFMVLVGLSMPSIMGHPAVLQHTPGAAAPSAVVATPPPDDGPTLYANVPPEVLHAKQDFPGWGMIAIHVLAITLLSNLGKMFPVLTYRREAPIRQRLALAVAMFPRGEVGAGVLVISLSYHLTGPMITIAALSLALNLLATGLFIVIVKRLIAQPPSADEVPEVAVAQA